MMQQSSQECGICNEPFFEGHLSWPFRYAACGHNFHVRCIREWYGKACPMCRSSWSVDETILFSRWEIEPPSPPSGQDSPIRTVAFDSYACCCHRLSPPPDFLPLEDRAMSFCSDAEYMCQSCGRTVAADSVPLPEPRPVCTLHGPRSLATCFGGPLESTVRTESYGKATFS